MYFECDVRSWYGEEWGEGIWSRGFEFYIFKRI
jgi:hypothetical protein